MNYSAKKCYYQNPFTCLKGQSRKPEIFDKINQALDKIKSKPFKQLVLESWKYDSMKGSKDDKKEQLKLVNLKGKDTNFTPRYNLSAYITSIHLIILRATDIVNCRPRSLYNSQALNLGTNIHICNNRNRSNYTMTYAAFALNVIDSSK